MHRAACPMAQRSGASSGEQFTRAYAGQLAMMFRRGIRPCDAKAYEETDRLHTEADAAEKAGRHAAAAKLRAAARAKNDATLEAQAAAKKAERRAVAEAKAEADRRDKEQRLLAVRLRGAKPGRRERQSRAREPAALRRERDEAKQALTLVQAKAADQAAAELLAAEEEAEASAAAAKKKKKKKKKKRGGGAAPMPAVDAPPAEPPAADAIAAMFEAAAPSPADEPTIDEPQQHDKLSDEISALLLRRLGLEERVGPVFAREQIDENALPFLTVEDLVEAGVAADDARKVVSAARGGTGAGRYCRGGYTGAGVQADTGAALLPHLSRVDGTSRDSGGRAHRDRSSIEDWLARGNTTSPTTGAPLEHLHLADNHLVKSMVAVADTEDNAPF